MNDKTWALALSAVLLCSAGVVPEVNARIPAAVIAQAEMSMLLTGKVDVDAQGRVTGLTVDEQAAYSAGVLDYVRRTAMAWQFEQILRDGDPVAFTSPVSMRLIARQAGEGSFEIRMDSASFGDGDKNDPASVRSVRMTPPRYPEAAFRAGITGTVYLAVNVGRDGKVRDVAAEQVDLTSAGNERVMAQAREVLARASLQAARGWTFRAPEQGDAVAADSWNLRIPVTFQLSDQQRATPRPGQWQPYIPGPRQRVPFLNKEDGPLNSSLREGGIYMAGRPGPRLKTPLEG